MKTSVATEGPHACLSKGLVFVFASVLPAIVVAIMTAVALLVLIVPHIGAGGIIMPIILVCGMMGGFGITFVVGLLSLPFRIRSRIIAFLFGVCWGCFSTTLIGFSLWTSLRAQNAQKAEQYRLENSYEHSYPEDKGLEYKPLVEKSIELAVENSGAARRFYPPKLPEHTIYLRAKRTGSGTIATFEKDDMEFAKEVYLCASRPEDGFIAFPARYITQNPTWDLQSMKQCPSDGYTNSLRIQPEWENKLFFFCKLGTNYGKGYITRQLRITSGEVVSRGKLYLLQDGTDSFVVKESSEMLTRE